MTSRWAMMLARGKRLLCNVFLAVSVGGLSGGCASMMPTIERVSGRVVGLDFAGVDMEFDVTVMNNAIVGIPTPRGRYAVRVSARDLVSSDNVPGVSLPAGGRGVFTLPATIRYVNLWEVAQEFKQADEVPYELNGAIIFDIAGRALTLDLAHEGTIPVLRIPTIEVSGVENSGFSLSGTDVTVSAQLTNPNIFALGVSKLGYKLMLGEIEVGRVEVDTQGMVDPGASCTLTARCHLSPRDAGVSVLKGGKLGAPRLRAVGVVTTPYGSATLPGS